MSKVEIKEQFDKQIFKLYNSFSKMQFLFSNYKKLVAKNSKFNNLHKGERCFIVGTGPSLKQINPEDLKGEVIFGVNYLYKGDFLNNLTPKYYCLYDQSFHLTNIDDTKTLVNMYPDTTFFLRTKAYKNIKKITDGMFNNIYFQHCNLFQYDDLIKVDLMKPVTAPFNVLLGCIQTAIYMGFSEIYLLGSDFSSFATPKVEHYYDNGKSDDRNMTLGFELKYYSMVAYHHYALNKYAASKGIKIVNLAENSLLDAYRKENIKKIL